jgi:deazaflavin-dependent oxidoreductase (nitroreductase family)
MSQQTSTMASLVRRIDDRVVKRVVRLMLRLGLAPKAFAMVETTGHRTGQARQTPVGNGLVGDTFWLIAARGEEAHYVRNLRHTPRVRVKIGRRWHTGIAVVLPDENPDDRLAYILRHFGWLRRFDARVLESLIRLNDSTPCVVRIDLDDGSQ